MTTRLVVDHPQVGPSRASRPAFAAWSSWAAGLRGRTPALASPTDRRLRDLIETDPVTAAALAALGRNASDLEWIEGRAAVARAGLTSKRAPLSTSTPSAVAATKAGVIDPVSRDPFTGDDRLPDGRRVPTWLWVARARSGL